MGITFVTDKTIASLNKKYLNKKGATDVLSFSLNSKDYLGDIVISVDTLKKEALRLEKSVQKHALFLIIHGLLHLLGYDHVKVADWKKMRKKEEELINLVNGG